jgi:hypothetical protein
MTKKLGRNTQGIPSRWQRGLRGVRMVSKIDRSLLFGTLLIVCGFLPIFTDGKLMGTAVGVCFGLGLSELIKVLQYKSRISNNPLIATKMNKKRKRSQNVKRC